MSIVLSVTMFLWVCDSVGERGGWVCVLAFKATIKLGKSIRNKMGITILVIPHTQEHTNKAA